MSVEYVFLEQAGYLLVKPKGEIQSHEEMTEHARVVINEAKARTLERILIKGDGLVIRLTAYDTVAFAKMMERMGLAWKGLRIATISTAQNEEARGFIETTLTNRGVGYKTFRNEEDALEWLGVQDAIESSP